MQRDSVPAAARRSALGVAMMDSGRRPWRTALGLVLFGSAMQGHRGGWLGAPTSVALMGRTWRRRGIRAQEVARSPAPRCYPVAA